MKNHQTGSWLLCQLNKWVIVVGNICCNVILTNLIPIFPQAKAYIDSALIIYFFYTYYPEFVHFCEVYTYEKKLQLTNHRFIIVLILVLNFFL